jgi:hypothetical protein
MIMKNVLGLVFAAGCLFAGTLSAEEIATDDQDSRTALALTRAEKAYVLGQMRLFVESIQIITGELVDGDKAKAVEAAAARGAKRNQNDPAFPSTLGAKLPQEWKQFGGSTRKGFDALADEIGKSENTGQSLKQLSEVMKNCVACHASYRVVDAKP